LFRKKKYKCINKQCKKELDEDMKICPYCGVKQNDKRYITKKNK
jgi:RNA polymerase subunit RPABC4/transcription elongation factor Spt4